DFRKCLSRINHGGGAVDLRDVHVCTGRDHHELEETARGPLLTDELDESSIGVDRFQHHGGLAHERRHTITGFGKGVHVSLHYRPDEDLAEPGAGGEADDLHTYR